ncbi:hypothetical protein [Flavobacterium sp.]|uniref:hypothetical protein n=1 Tax=Flavobacterium sp. TaxID=239 RepID=UPI0028BD3089|nr:hypothetical protein [Flavobacterium sp.]
MKRVSLILGIALVSVFASCSLDDDFEMTDTDASKMSVNALLVRSIATISERDGTMITDDYQYNGSKLLKINSSDGREIVYTYAGDLIIRKDFFQDNILNSKEIFEYNRQYQLIKYKRQNASGVTTYNAIYTNNTDGTVSVKGYSGGTTNQSSQILDRKVFTSGIRVNKVENYTTQNGSPATQVFNYSYDTKNSPFKNITGFDKLAYYDITVNSNYYNVQSVTRGTTEVESVQYTYNGENYPSSANKGSLSFLYTY